MIDLEKERNLFQDFCEKNFDFERHEQTYFDKKTQCYENDIGEDTESINIAWAAWLASANREGFKLVPIEPTKEMYCAGTHELTQIDFSDLHDDDSISIYKAMIGAAL